MTMHDGHRKRMRERYRQTGLEGFADHEVLELLLFYGRARGDVNPLAHTLINTFGSLQGVLEARISQLISIPGIGEETATLISLIAPLFRRYHACLCRSRQQFNTREEIKQFCLSLLTGWRTERLYVIALDAGQQLLGYHLVAEGSTGSVQVQPRQVVESALDLNARSLVICHNHPGGSSHPSIQDVELTERLCSLLHHLEIDLLDHLIVAGNSIYSMAENTNLHRSHYISPLPASQAADSSGQLLFQFDIEKRKEST